MIIWNTHILPLFAWLEDPRALLVSEDEYENKLDEYLQKFEIKGALATFNQGQNIFNAYFELVEEA